MTGDTVPSTRFDTGGLPEGDQFDAWREAGSGAFEAAPVATAPARGFAAAAKAFHLGEMVLVNARFERQSLVRTSRQVRTDWLDHFLVQYYRRGGHVGHTETGGMKVTAGTVSVVDLGQPLQTRSTDAECVSLVVPRDVMTALLPGADALHGQVLEGACSALLGDHLSSLERRLPAMPAADAPDLARATGHLVAACLRSTDGTSQRPRAHVDELMLARARRFVEAWIDAPPCDRELTADDICCATGTSRSRLYVLFKPQGGVRRYVQGRRLARLHSALADPGERASIMVLAERHGFSSHAHLCRLFRRRYGYSPGELRAKPALVLKARATQGMPDAANDGPGFGDWIRTLRA